jgi:hypothetical protein
MALILVLFAALHATVLLAFRTRWHFDFTTRTLLPAVASLALLAACAFQRKLGDAQLRRVSGIAIAMTALATVTSLAAADHYRRWRGFNDPRHADRPAAQWARAVLGRAGAGRPSVRLVTVGHLVPYLHVATDGAPVGGLPDVPQPATLFARSPGIATVVILKETPRGFRCPEYRRVYRAVLDRAADSIVRGEGFTAWWLSHESAVDRLEPDVRQLTSACAVSGGS